MKLQQAAAYFNTVTLEGWDGAAWVEGVAEGNFLTYDRFLGPRTFGHKQRMFLMGNTGASLMPYELVRVGGDIVYLVMSKNHDYKNDVNYATSFLLQQADFDIEIIQYVLTPAPSGIGGSKVEDVVATYRGDVERYNSETSREFDDVRYETTIFTLPFSAKAFISADSELRVDSVLYEVKEIYPFLDALQVRALERA